MKEFVTWSFAILSTLYILPVAILCCRNRTRLGGRFKLSPPWEGQ